MFFIIDKSKIYSYIIAISTVVILFVAATGLNDINSKQNTTVTSSNILEENIVKDIEKNSKNPIKGNNISN